MAIAKTKACGGVVASNGSVALFEKIVTGAYSDALSRFDAADDLLKKKRQKAILKELDDIAKRTQLDLDAWAVTQIPTYYEAGAFAATKDMVAGKQIGMTFDQSFASVHGEAIDALVGETRADIATAMKGFTNTGQRLINQGIKDGLIEQVAKGSIAGSTRKEITKDIKNKLKKSGIVSLKDKAGRTWDLNRYGSMLARTKLTQSSNMGTAMRMQEWGVDLAIVSDHIGECAACSMWEGEIISITGQTKGYPSLMDAERGGLFHPNCRHIYSALPNNRAYLDDSTVWDATQQRYVNFNDLPKQDIDAAVKNLKKVKKAAKSNVRVYNKTVSSAETDLYKFNQTAIGKQERMIAINADGKKVLEITGTANKVSIPFEDLPKLNNSILLHNHPNVPTLKISSSLSMNDLRVATKHDVKEMRAIATQATYIVKRPTKSGGWFYKYVEKNNKHPSKNMQGYLLENADAKVRNSKAYNELVTEAREKYEGIVSSGADKKTISKARHLINTELHDEAIKRIADDLGWDYKVVKK